MWLCQGSGLYTGPLGWQATAAVLAVSYTVLGQPFTGTPPQLASALPLPG